MGDERNNSMQHDFVYVSRDFCVNDEDKKYEPKDIRDIIRVGLNKVVMMYGYDYPEDSTRVLTNKTKDFLNSRIIHSCDFAIVYECGDERQQYIHYNKKQATYQWEYKSQGFTELTKKSHGLSIMIYGKM